MPRVRTLRDHVAFRIRHRVGTASARYKLALSSGFVVASVAMSTVVISQSGQAQDFLSALGKLFSAPQQAAPQAAVPAAYQTGYVERVGRRTSHRDRADAGRHSRRRVAEQEEVGDHRRRSRAPVRTAEDDTPVRLGRASICVRSCDGFAFPVGTFHGEGDLAAHEATCRSECPGAETALYVLPNSSSPLGEAVEVRSGHAYSQKASSFHYTTYLDESCTCHPQSGNRVASLLHDFTLRRGDAVVTHSGIKVFHGGEHYPYRQADFIQLAQSRDVKKAAKATFRDIERASLLSSHPALAQAAKPVPAASLKTLEHQAALTP